MLKREKDINNMHSAEKNLSLFLVKKNKKKES